MFLGNNEAIRTAVFMFALAAFTSAPFGRRVCAAVPNQTQLRQLVEHLSQLDAAAKIECLKQLCAMGPAAVYAKEELLQIWREADGRTDDRLLASSLDVFRAMGSAGAPAAKELSGYLPHEAELYWDRDQLEVIRLRSYLMVTIGEIGLPAQAYPYLLDSLAHFDERVVAIEIGSAARALRSVGRRGRQFIPYLVRVIPNETAEEEFSLERYAVDFPEAEATTAQIESIRTLAALCTPHDKTAVGMLQRLADLPDNTRWDRRIREEARRALKAIAASNDSITEQKQTK
jgi:hypothetical protein